MKSNKQVVLKRKHHNRIQQTDKRIFLKTAKAKQNQIHTQEALVKSQNHLEFPTGAPAKPARIPKIKYKKGTFKVFLNWVNHWSVWQFCQSEKLNEKDDDWWKNKKKKKNWVLFSYETIEITPKDWKEAWNGVGREGCLGVFNCWNLHVVLMWGTWYSHSSKEGQLFGSISVSETVQKPQSNKEHVCVHVTRTFLTSANLPCFPTVSSVTRSMPTMLRQIILAWIRYVGTR